MASFSGPKISNRIADDVPALQALLSSLAKLTPDSGNTDYPTGTKRVAETTNGWELQQYNGSGWVTLEKWNINAQKVDGYSAATGTTANTIPVRDASGKLPGDISGNAATASKAAALSAVNPIEMGGTGASTAAEARSNLGVAPTSHASSGTDYGIGTSANYGHVKVSDMPDAALTAASGHALSPAGAKTELDKKLDKSGGMMSGPIIFADGGSVQKTGQPFKGELLAGAGDTRVWVFDEDSQSLPGHVMIRGANTDLVVKNDGTCAVNGANILTSAGGTMLGPLRVGVTDNIVAYIDDTLYGYKYFLVQAGTWGVGSRIQMFRDDSPNEAGTLVLTAGSTDFRIHPMYGVFINLQPVLTLTASWNDGNGNWYRKYSDGWIEQGGYVEAPGTYSFHIGFTNVPVDVRVQHMNRSLGGAEWWNSTIVTSRTTSNFTFSSGGGNAGYCWIACGY